jgi:hypothetical protein
MEKSEEEGGSVLRLEVWHREAKTACAMRPSADLDPRNRSLRTRRSENDKSGHAPPISSLIICIVITHGDPTPVGILFTRLLRRGRYRIIIAVPPESQFTSP